MSCQSRREALLSWDLTSPLPSLLMGNDADPIPSNLPRQPAPSFRDLKAMLQQTMHAHTVFREQVDARMTSLEIAVQATAIIGLTLPDPPSRRLQIPVVEEEHGKCPICGLLFSLRILERHVGHHMEDPGPDELEGEKERKCSRSTVMNGACPRRKHRMKGNPKTWAVEHEGGEI